MKRYNVKICKCSKSAWEHYKENVEEYNSVASDEREDVLEHPTRNFHPQELVFGKVYPNEFLKKINKSEYSEVTVDDLKKDFGMDFEVTLSLKEILLIYYW